MSHSSFRDWEGRHPSSPQGSKKNTTPFSVFYLSNKHMLVIRWACLYQTFADTFLTPSFNLHHKNTQWKTLSSLGIATFQTKTDADKRDQPAHGERFQEPSLNVQYAWDSTSWLSKRRQAVRILPENSPSTWLWGEPVENSAWSRWNP